MSLENPTIDWVQLAGGLGVNAVSAKTRAAFEGAFAQAMREPGPWLIEAVI
jgi:acetolactate synthase-1/2/3 large subunit